MLSSKKLATKPFSQSCATFFFLGHSSEYGRKKSSCNSEILYRLFSRILAFTFSFKSSMTKDGCPPSLFVTHVLPAFFEKSTPFPHIPFVHNTYTTHFNIVPVMSPSDKHFNNLTYTEM